MAATPWETAMPLLNTHGRYGCLSCDGVEGPTACMAHPKVVANIRQLVRGAKVLSTADARLAQNMGLLDIPSIGRAGWNDGVIYPPDDAPAPTRGRTLAPTRRLAMAKAVGKMHCLVLLVDFSDNPGRTPPAHYEKLLFDASDPDSMTSFYRELSYGKLEVTGQVVGWIRAPRPYSFYVDNQSGTGTTFPKNTPGLLQDALAAYAQTNSLAPFDLNADGFVDGLFLVHAGEGAEVQATPAKRKAMIWSHKWTLPRPFVDHGVKAYAYFTAPEDGRLGVFSHEFGHFIGLPDLYDTSYRSRGIGDWCLMAGGSWGGGGSTPARLSAWCLATLGWITPRNVKATANYKIDTLAKDKTDCLRVWTGGQAGPEYFLLENRQQTGRDVALPGSGLAVWHIDERQGDNTNPIAYRVALVQADGKRELELNVNDGDAGDLFPGTGKVTSVKDTGAFAPSTRANDGSGTGVALTAIKSGQGKVGFRVKV
jgi:immune inhibitor A